MSAREGGRLHCTYCGEWGHLNTPCPKSVEQPSASQPDGLAAIKAEALREAARWLDSDAFPHGEGDWLDGCCDAIAALHDRAALLDPSPAKEVGRG